MNTLVTGGGGFLGRYIVEQLVARGDRVWSFGRNIYPGLTELGVEQIQGDLRNQGDVLQACQGIDSVFHVAAVAGISVQPEDFFAINTGGTKNILAACLQQNVQTLVYTSSPSVTFSGVPQLGSDESEPYPKKWLAHYPHSKALAEQAVLAANNEQGLKTCALRPHLIWGVRDQHLIPRLIARARSKKLRIVGEGSNQIDTIYVENAADAHLLAADALRSEVTSSKVAGKAYFLSQDEPVNCWDWINALLELAGEPPVTKKISYHAAATLGGMMETWYQVFGLKSEPRMTRFLAAQLAMSHWFDISAAKRDFGYHPRISTAEGMQKMSRAMYE